MGPLWVSAISPSRSQGPCICNQGWSASVWIPCYRKLVLRNLRIFDRLRVVSLVCTSHWSHCSHECHALSFLDHVLDDWVFVGHLFEFVDEQGDHLEVRGQFEVIGLWLNFRLDALD